MPERPQRITLSRAKGWRMPPNTVKVDRSTKWGNPYRVARDVQDVFGLVSPIAVVDGSGKAVQTHFLYMRQAMSWAVIAFRGSIQAASKFEEIARAADPAFYLIACSISELRGKNLACWCKPGEPCHADVLLELANREEPA